jgi:hypothetical protein
MAGGANQAIRVVAVRRTGQRAADFALRHGEQGLSLFACDTQDEVRMVVEAVRAAGKSGKLAAAALAVQDLEALGLEVVQVPGGTPDPRANLLHVEARLAPPTAELARRLGQQSWEFFNQQIAGALRDRARVIYEG